MTALKMHRKSPAGLCRQLQIYAQPGFGDTMDFRVIKRRYHLCAVSNNPYGIVPKGPDEFLIRGFGIAFLGTGEGINVVGDR
jgi:hypothetical protein